MGEGRCGECGDALGTDLNDQVGEICSWCRASFDVPETNDWDNPYGAGRCRDCGDVLLDDLDNFVEEVCFSCHMDVYRHADPASLGARIGWAIQSAWGWPRRALITWRIHRDLNRSGLPF